MVILLCRLYYKGVVFACCRHEASYSRPFISGLTPTVAACGDATAMPVLLSPHP